MTDLTEAARATRKYFVESSLETGVQTCFIVETKSGRVFSGPILHSYTKAQVACDRLNLVAVLEALREPSEGMCRAGYSTQAIEYPDDVWRAMIEAAIAEARKG